MEILRLIAALVLMCLMCFGSVRAVVTGLRTGRIRYGRAQGERVAQRKRQPLFFWSLIVIFALFALASICVFVWVARETLFK